MTEVLVAVIGALALVLTAAVTAMLPPLLQTWKAVKPNGGETDSISDRLDRMDQKMEVEAVKNDEFRTDMRNSVAIARAQAETALRVVLEDTVLQLRKSS